MSTHTLQTFSAFPLPGLVDNLSQD